MLKKCFAFLLLLCATHLLVGQQAVELKRLESIQHFSEYLSVYEDLSASLTWEQISQKNEAFIPYQVDQYQFNKEGVYWFHFDVNYALSIETDWVLDFGIGIDEVEVKMFPKFTELKKTGRTVPMSAKDLKTSFSNAVHFTLSPSDPPESVYFRIKNISHLPLKSEVNLVTRQEWEQQQADYWRQLSFPLLFQGVLWIMILYNLLVYLLNRDRPYLYYSLYLFCVSIYTLQTYGFLMEFFIGEFPTTTYYFRNASGMLALFFYLAFIRHFLDISIHHPKWNKAITWAQRLLLVDLAACFASLAFGYNIPLNRLIAIVAILLCCLFIISLIIFLVRKHRNNRLVRYVVLGTVCLCVFVLIGATITLTTGVKALGVSVSLGTAFEILLFSLGLGYRMKLTEQAKLAAEEKNAQMLKEQNQLLEVKVEERTQEIQNQKEEMLVQNEELQQQQEEIVAQRDFIESQNQLLVESNGQVTNSIRYAKTIQQAILPLPERLSTVFSNHFVFFKPKDIVSGDFYWFEQLKQYRFISVVDCTGHGVPGAFMSLIGCSILNEEVIKREVVDPAKVLTLMHESVKKRLRQEDDVNQDGMDAAFCRLEDLPNGQVKVTFCGAKRPLYYFVKGSTMLAQLAGDRRSIGGYQGKVEKHFTNKDLVLPKGSRLYLTSDGMADQNNEEGRKLGSPQFKQLLEKIQDLPLHEQEDTLKQFLRKHQGFEKQRDDITVVAIEI